jgi:hypothetical protein
VAPEDATASAVTGAWLEEYRTTYPPAWQRMLDHQLNHSDPRQYGGRGTRLGPTRALKTVSDATGRDKSRKDVPLYLTTSNPYADGDQMFLADLMHLEFLYPGSKACQKMKWPTFAHNDGAGRLLDREVRRAKRMRTHAYWIEDEPPAVVFRALKRWEGEGLFAGGPLSLYPEARLLDAYVLSDRPLRLIPDLPLEVQEPCTSQPFRKSCQDKEAIDRAV